MTIQYDPQKVTDWLTPLEKVYARQSRQLDEYHNQLRERDRQEEAATLDIPEMFSQLASFSTSIKSVVDARKTKQDEKFKKKLDNLDTDQLKNLNTWFRTEDRKQLKEDHNPYIKTVGKSKDLLFGKKLKDLSPREEMLTKKYLANINTKGYTRAAFEDEIEGDIDRYNEYQAANEATKAQLHEDWMKEKNSHLKLSDGLFASSQAEEMRRMAATGKTTAKSKAKAQILSTEQLKFKERTKLFFENPDPYDGVLFINQETTDRAAFLKDIPGGKTAIQQATESIVNDIYDLGKAGEFSIDKLNKLFTGELKDHPAAKNIPDAFFDKEGKYYTHLTKGILEGETVKLNKIKAAGKLEAVQLLNKGYENGFKSQAEFDAAALPLKSRVDSETWKQLEKFNFVSQSKSVYNREAEHLNNSISNGTFLTKSNRDRVKNSENNKVVTEFGDKQNELIQHQKDNQFPNFEERDKTNNARVIQDSGHLTFAEGEPLGANTWPGKLSLEMTKQEDIFYQKFLKEFPNDTDIPTRVNTAMDALKVRKGFGIPIGQPGAGEWSKDDKGNYPNFVRAKIGERWSNIVTNNTDTWDKEVTATWMWSKFKDTPQTNRVDVFLSTPGNVVTPEANVDMILSGNLTPEFTYKIGKIPGKTEGEALIQMTEGLIASKIPAHKALVKQYDLENKLKELTTPSKDGKEETPLAKKIKAQQYLTDLVDEIGDPDISNIHKIGLDKASPKQQKRYFYRLQMISDIANDETELLDYKRTLIQ
tara:strand:- start:91 stop:2373 length:2283 start_codon:yes stop_codon:yes gene_type:complete